MIYIFCVEVTFSLHLCYYFENDLCVTKSSKNLLETFAWFPGIKIILKIITNDKGKS